MENNFNIAEAEANQKCLDLYNEYANGRISIEECIAQSNEVQRKFQDEINRLLVIEYYWKQQAFIPKILKCYYDIYAERT